MKLSNIEVIDIYGDSEKWTQMSNEPEVLTLFRFDYIYAVIVGRKPVTL